MARGMDFIISIGDPAVRVAGQRGGSLSLSQDTTEITTKDGNAWKDFAPTFREWSVSGDGIVFFDDAGYRKLRDAFFNGEIVDVELSNVDETFRGRAIIADFPQDFPYDDEVTFSVELQGVGALVVTSVLDEPTV